MLSMKDCGLMLEPQEGMSVEEIVDWAQYAESTGYGYIFRSDHLLPTSKAERKDQTELRHSPECWTTMGVLAAETKKIRFGTMVSPVGFRNPALLARMACTLHSYSRGRLILGLGAGWYQDEYAAHGIPFPDTSIRIEELEDALKIIRPLTEGDKVHYTGKYFSARVQVHPKPYNGERVHMVIGGSGRGTIRLAAEYADEWNVFSPTPEKYSTLRKIEQEEEAKAIRSSSRKVIPSIMGPFFIFLSRREMRVYLEKQMKSKNLSGGVDSRIRRMKDHSIACGTVEDFKSAIGEKMDAGIERFYFQVLDPRDKKMARLLTTALKSKRI